MLHPFNIFVIPTSKLWQQNSFLQAFSPHCSLNVAESPLALNETIAYLGYNAKNAA